MYDLPLPHIVTLNQGWKRHLLLLQIGRFLGNESNPAWCHRYERNLQVRPSPWSAHQQWNELSGLHQCDPSTQPEILPNSVRPKAYKLCLGFQLQRHDHQGAKLMQKNSQDAPLELLWPANIMCTCKPCLLDITKKQQGLNLQWTYQVVFWTAGLLFSALHRFLDSRLSISTSTSITTLWCTRRWLHNFFTLPLWLSASSPSELSPTTTTVLLSGLIDVCCITNRGGELNFPD